MEKLKGQWLIVRADAGMEIGVGHLMRTLALAQAWKDNGGKVVYITSCRNEKLLQRLKDEEFIIHTLEKPHPDNNDWLVTKNVLAEYPGAWVALDGYNFDAAYQKYVKESGHRLLVIDDTAHLKHYCPDILLNQNIGAGELSYSCESYTKKLLDTRYALLRRDFLAWKIRQHVIPEVARNILVTMGGSDPANVTLKILEALREVDVPGMEATVIIGASNPHAAVLGEAVKESRMPIHLVYNAENMPEWMARADVAVSSAGSTVWELLFMGTPALLLTLFDNQRYIGSQLEKTGAAVYPGWAANLDSANIAQKLSQMVKSRKMRIEISRKAKKIIDGDGVQRVIAAMLSN